MMTVTADGVRSAIAEEIAAMEAMILQAAEVFEAVQDTGKREVLIGNYRTVLDILLAMPGRVASAGPFEDDAALRACVHRELQPARDLVAARDEILSTSGSA
jgi:hypothetical protein